VVLVIILLIIIAGGGIYYLSRQKETSVKSIAILPFDNLSSDKENQYFADGLVEDLLNRLSTILHTILLTEFGGIPYSKIPNLYKMQPEYQNATFIIPIL
jgi:hypothetical protein